MRFRGFALSLAALNLLPLVQLVLGANEAFGSIMVFLYSAYHFDRLVTDGKPALANACTPQPADGPADIRYKGCNFHGFLRHVLRAGYDPAVFGASKVADPWMPSEAEAADMHTWPGLDADAGYDEMRVLGSSGHYFNTHLMFGVVATRMAELAKKHPDQAAEVYGGLRESADRIQFSRRAAEAGLFVSAVRGLLDKGSDLETDDVGGLYGLPGYKVVNIPATAAKLKGSKLSEFRSSVMAHAKKRAGTDENVAFHHVIALRETMDMGAEGVSRCSSRNREGEARKRDEERKKDEENQSCKKKGKKKRSLLDIFAEVLFKRQSNNNNNNNCVTVTTTTYSTMKEPYYFTPDVFCDPDKYTQACYHYRSVMSVQKELKVNTMVEFTCRDGTVMKQDGKATKEWGSTVKAKGKPLGYAQHNYAWTSGLPGRRKCDRDEWPPRYFWPVANKDFMGKKAQRVRFIPATDNQSAGSIFKGFCDEEAPYGPTTTAIINGKNERVPNVQYFRVARQEQVNVNLGNDGTMTETTTSFIETPRPIFSFKFDDSKFVLPNDGLDDNACIPDIVRGTDPGWALLTYDEYYDRNPDLKQYATLYNTTVVPAVLPALQPPAPPAPGPVVPRRLRRGTRGGWADPDVIVEDEEAQTCLNNTVEEVAAYAEEYVDAYENAVQCVAAEVEVIPGSAVENLDTVATPVPPGENDERPPPLAGREAATPDFPMPTGSSGDD